MSYEQKDNSGSLFKNDRKETEKHPDRKGSALIDGVAYWVSGWVKHDKNGNPWMSLSFQKKEQSRYDKEAERQGLITRPERKAEMDDEIPF
jgi:hypothetical protein